MRKLMSIALLAVLSTFVACEKSDNEDNNDPQKVGIVGEWYSSGANVAPLLVTYFAVDSIYTKFESNNTYRVESYSGGAKTVYLGTYTQEKSGAGAIWKIVLNQTAPTAVKSEGIFEISTGTPPYTMQYEVVQTEPSIGATPPTAEKGFGSTSNGALGETNIQKFVKYVK